MGIETFDLFL